MALKRVTDTQSVMYTFSFSAKEGTGVCSAASGGNLGETTGIADLGGNRNDLNENLED